jgi:hypothetical protein
MGCLINGKILLFVRINNKAKQNRKIIILDTKYQFLNLIQVAILAVLIFQKINQILMSYQV